MFVISTIKHRLHRGCQTIDYPAGPAPRLPELHGGALRFEAEKCDVHCSQCTEVCPTEAIRQMAGEKPVMDLGRCIFCARCVEVCGQKAISQTGDHRMAVRRPGDLLLGAPGKEELRLAQALDEKMRKMFGRSLRFRQVSAGGCNACESDINVLSTIGWDLGRFGIQVVASPRHADGLLVTGPVARNMELALRKTYEAVPEPRLVVAVGTCAISGGLFAASPETLGGAGSVLPVDLLVPGCPPHPITILDGLLRLLSRVEDRVR